MNLVLLSGGLGGARLVPALARAIGPRRLTVIANVGDDLEWMGLRVCPDLDSILYALAGVWDAERGWGRKGETFAVRAALESLGASGWFGIGDRDLALHLERTLYLRSGKSLTEAIRSVARRLGVRGAEVVPASDRLAPTRLVLRDGRRLDFQEWYVRERARPPIARTLPSRAAASAAALRALAAADAVILGPSNPITSIGAILALRGVRAGVRAAGRSIAVSPVAARRRSRDPAIAHHARARRRVLEAEGLSDRPASIVQCYAGLVDCFVLDRSDHREVKAIERVGMEPVLTDLLDPHRLAQALARLVG